MNSEKMNAPETKTYYLLRDFDGYGSEFPVCVDRKEAERLIREWYNTDDAPDFNEVWREADEYDIASYGHYDSDWD